jgi:gas vesicle protein
MDTKKQLLEDFALKQGKLLLESKLSKGEIDEASFNAMLGGLKNVASKVANKVSDKTKETGKKISDKVKETGSDIRNSVQGGLESIGNEVISAGKKVKEKTDVVVDKVKETGKKIEKGYAAGKLPQMKKELEDEYKALLKKIEEYNKTAVKAGETKIKLKFRI